MVALEGAMISIRIIGFKPNIHPIANAHQQALKLMENALDQFFRNSHDHSNTEVIGYDLRRLAPNRQRMKTTGDLVICPVAPRIDSRCWDSLMPAHEKELQTQLTYSLEKLIEYATLHIVDHFEIIACGVDSWTRLRSKLRKCWDQKNETLRMVDLPFPKYVQQGWSLLGFDVVDCGLGAADWSNPVHATPWDVQNSLSVTFAQAKTLRDMLVSQSDLGELFVVSVYSLGVFERHDELGSLLNPPKD
ncbi:MAG: hypothetical protein JNM28_08380 [Armatimonadetes bacterium]|nr:hypothetical protein [Armatimonadota bacterium]